MAFDVVFHPDTGIEIFLWFVFIGKISSASGADSPIRIHFLCCWVGFVFFSGLDFFKILGEESDRDVDLSLSLCLPLLCPSFSDPPQTICNPRAEVSVGFDCSAPT